MIRRSCIFVTLVFLFLLIGVNGYAQQSFSLRYDSQTADTLYLTFVVYTPSQAMPGNSIHNYHHYPWWGVAVDGATPYWPTTSGYYSYTYTFGTYAYFPIAWPITVPEGYHSFQGYLYVDNVRTYSMVGNPLQVYIGQHTHNMVDWSLVMQYIDHQGVHMRIRIYNPNNDAWTMQWPSQPIACFSLNGQMIYTEPINEPYAITVYPTASYYIPLDYIHPLQDGIYRMQAYLILPGGAGIAPVGDEVSVTLGNVENIDYGAGDLPSALPIDFSHQHSLYECIYTSEELGGLHGSITSLAFQSQFPDSSLVDVPVQVYLGTTSESNLANGWIPASQLSLVYDGLLSFPVGEEEILFNLENHLTLPQNQNLVMMVKHEGNASQMMAGTYFRCQNADPANGAMAVSNVAPPYPENPGDVVLSGKTPQISIYYTPGADAEDELLSPAMSISAYPNPFSSASTLEYDLKEPADVEIAVYNLKGQLVKNLCAGARQAGTHT
ncbi:MAG: hypothetical protein KA984_02390, partial [Candidatus Cloacimonetes bacterium]|nr:hypothetical protein [Candidatus Cloacimonadota bacterium]